LSGTFVTANFSFDGVTPAILVTFSGTGNIGDRLPAKRSVNIQQRELVALRLMAPMGRCSISCRQGSSRYLSTVFAAAAGGVVRQKIDDLSYAIFASLRQIKDGVTQAHQLSQIKSSDAIKYGELAQRFVKTLSLI
jgi:hypothetical protein